jgi:hypothetical protein
MRYGTVMRLMCLLVLSTVLLQVAAGVPRRFPPRHSDSDKSIDWSSAMVESTMKRYSTAKDLGSWGSSMYSYVTAMAVQRGYVPKSYMSVARKGYEGVLSKISLGPDGLINIADICEGTNVADLAYYFGRKRVSNDFHGLGAFLIMNEKFMSLSGKGKSKTIQKSASGN